MARSTTQLIHELSNLGKQASVESCTDPAVKGEASKEVDPKKIIEDLPGQGVSLDVPAVTPTELAGAQKVEQGDVATPSPEAFTAEGAAAKAASGLITGMADLRQKLANIGASAPAPAAAPAAPAPVTAPAAVAPAPVEDKTAAYVPGDMLLKVAFKLMETSRGQTAVLEALDELEGAAAAKDLVKRAADEHASFLRDYTVERLQQAEAEAAQMKEAAARSEAEAQYQQLIKSASPEQRQAIDNSAFLIKRAEQMFAENPGAHQALLYGFAIANKVAAAMEAGMDPAAAAGEAAGGGEGPASPEELMAALEALVQQGAITPEQAAQLAQELVGGMGGGEAPEGMPPGEDPAQYAQKAAAADEALTTIAKTIFPA